MFLVFAFVQIYGAREIANHVLASGIVSESENIAPAVVLGRAIMGTPRTRDLLGAVLFGPPAGLLGSLARLGPDPLAQPRMYHELARLFLSRDPGDRRRAKTLMQIQGKLFGPQIEIVSALDPVLLHPVLVAKLREVEEVDELHHALDYVRANFTWADDEAVRASLSRLRADNHRGDLIRYWASRFDRLPHDLDVRGDPTLVILSSAAMMSAAARKYKNCLKSRICAAFLGTHLYIEYRPSNPTEPGAIVELRRTNIGFFLESMQATDNRRVRADRAAIIRRKLGAYGVALLDHAPGDPVRVRTVGRLLGQWALGDADNDALGEEPLDAAEDLRQALAEVA